MSRTSSSSSAKTISPLSRQGSRRGKTVKRLGKSSPRNLTPVSPVKVQVVRTISDVPMQRLYSPLSESPGGGFHLGTSRRPMRRSSHKNAEVKQHRSARIAVTSPYPQEPGYVSLPPRRHGAYYISPPSPPGTRVCLLIFSGLIFVSIQQN
jgi:hypothetical protein